MNTVFREVSLYKMFSHKQDKARFERNGILTTKSLILHEIA